jgi:3-methyl-2-oxobutanoate hydroxymethyltransferase
MREIQQRTGLATISLGSGPHADVLFLFQNDLCGESDRIPRHARRYADLAALHRQIQSERVRALTEFRADVASGGFPSDDEVATVEAAELAAFVQALEDGLDGPA